jgi:DNA-binding NarL/FixJ family response regulator
MVTMGVKGFMLKNDGIKELLQAISEIVSGNVWFSNELLQKIIVNVNKNNRGNTPTELSDREVEVLKLVCEGLTADEIAKMLNLSYDTIKTHKSNLLSKTGCNNAPSLVMYAIRNKIIDI